MITDYDRINFNQDHILMRNERYNGWVAVNKHTRKEVSPTYSDPQGAIYFVVRLLSEQMDECIEEVLGGGTSSLHDVDSFHRGFSSSIQRDGEE